MAADVPGQKSGNHDVGNMKCDASSPGLVGTPEKAQILVTVQLMIAADASWATCWCTMDVEHNLSALETSLQMHICLLRMPYKSTWLSAPEFFSCHSPIRPHGCLQTLPLLLLMHAGSAINGHWFNWCPGQLIPNQMQIRRSRSSRTCTRPCASV